MYYTLDIYQPNLGLVSQITYQLPLNKFKIEQITSAISKALQEDEMTTFHNVLCVGSIPTITEV